MFQTIRNLRIIFFLVIFLSMSSWEMLIPRRQLVSGKLTRWRINISLASLGLVLERLIAPLGATGFAFLGLSRGYGLFNLIPSSPWISFPLSVIFLDLAVYFQHVLFHHVTFLKKIHGVHHTDMDLDITSGIRFHPLEILISLFLKALVIFITGAPPEAVVTFEIILNGASLFNHSNIYISPRIDRLLRFILVTPDMHRVHHSVIESERNSNYGFSVSWWDRIFGNYTSSPSKGQLKMDLGLSLTPKGKVLPFSFLLTMPFRKK